MTHSPSAGYEQITAGRLSAWSIIGLVVLTAHAAWGNDFCYWVQQAGSSQNVGAGGMSVDGNGNSFLTGTFDGIAYFGGIALTNNNSLDVCVAKYDRNGQIVWAKRGGGTGFDRGQAVAVDAGGNSIVTGSISGSATFGGITLTNTGGQEIFVARYDHTGNVLWARQAGAKVGSSGYGIAVDGASNIVVAGYFEGRAHFGSTSLTNAGATDLFVVKYDRSGNVLWARRAGGPGADSGNGVGMDAAGNCYVAGTFSETASFGTTNLTSLHDLDIFLAKYNSLGTLLWVRQASGDAYDNVKGIATDTNGNSHITGRFEGSFLRLGAQSLPNSGSSDLFVAKYDSAGQLVWASHDDRLSGDDSGNGITVDAAGKVTVIGYLNGEICLSHYASNGLLQRTTFHLGSASEKSGVGVDTNGYAYLYGGFAGQVHFNDEDLFTFGGEQIFLVQRPNSFPANDDFANRTIIPNGVHRVTGNNFGACKEPSEPNPGGNEGGKSVWWSWTAPQAGRVRITSAGSSFIPILSVYTGTSPGNLSPVASAYVFGTDSAVTFEATAGTAYRIAVDGFSGGGGSSDGCPIPGDIVLTLGYLPVASVTDPATDRAIPLSMGVVVNATASDRDGTITNFALYDNGVKIAEGTSPLNFFWRPTTVGTHALTAVATDNDGFQTISAPRNLTAGLGIVAITNFVTITNEDDLTVSFSAGLQIRNLGTVPTGPMRLRILARAGYSYDPFGSNAVPQVPADILLGTYALAPASLGPDSSRLANVTGVAPAPSNSVSQFWIAFGWGVYALLDEQIGGDWIVHDRRFLLFGVWPIFNGGQGPGAGSIRLDPPLGGAGFVPVALTNVVINGPAGVNEGASAQYSGTAFYDNRTMHNFTNTEWMAPPFNITTSGVFTAGSVVSNTPITLTCPFFFAGHEYQSNRIVTVLNLSAPVVTNFTRVAGTNWALTIKGVPNRRHAIESATFLGFHFTFDGVATGRTDAVGEWRYTNSPPAGLRRFYRAREAE